MPRQGENAARSESREQRSLIERGRHAAQLHVVDQRGASYEQPKADNEVKRVTSRARKFDAAAEVDRILAAGAELQEYKESLQDQLAGIEGNPTDADDLENARANSAEILRLQSLIGELRKRETETPFGQYHLAIEEYKSCLDDILDAGQTEKPKLQAKLREISKKIHGLEITVAEQQVNHALERENLAHYKESLEQEKHRLQEQEILDEDESFALDLIGKKLNLVNEKLRIPYDIEIDDTDEVDDDDDAAFEDEVLEMPPDPDEETQEFAEIPAEALEEMQDPRNGPEAGDDLYAVADAALRTETKQHLPPAERIAQARTSIENLKQSKNFSWVNIADWWDNFEMWADINKSIREKEQEIEDIERQQEIEKLRKLGEIAKANLEEKRKSQSKGKKK